MGTGLSGEPANNDASNSVTEAGLQNLLDPRSSIAAALDFDGDAMAEIDRIVQELETTKNPLKEQQLKKQHQQEQDAQKKFQVLQQLAESGNERAVAIIELLNEAAQSQRQQEKADLQAERRGTADANDWLQTQVEQGVKEMAAAEKVKAQQAAMREAEASKAAAFKEEEALKECVRKTALKEMEAREGLRLDATDAAKNRLEDAEIAAQQAKVRLEGVSAVLAPRKPCAVSSEEGGRIPEAPKPKVVQAKKKVKLAGPVPELYAVLEICIDATFDEIKKGFRKQALEWHPDKNRGRETVATERFQKITEAFDTLYDPQKRERYDSGQVISTKGKAKKLQGHGWAAFADEDDAALTPLGLRYRTRSWNGYVFYGGRIDDDENDLIMEDSDPRTPQQRIKIFWRGLADRACAAKHDHEEDGEGGDWAFLFIRSVWKDTPSDWPKAAKLQTMNEASQQEWKERKMVYNRRKEKLQIHMRMHKQYLALPDRVKKEQERMKRMGLGMPPVMG